MIFKRVNEGYSLSHLVAREGVELVMVTVTMDSIACQVLVAEVKTRQVDRTCLVLHTT